MPDADARLDRVEAGLKALGERMDEQFGKVNERFAKVDQRVAKVDKGLAQVAKTVEPLKELRDFVGRRRSRWGKLRARNSA